MEAFERARPQPLQQAGPAGNAPGGRPARVYAPPPPAEPGIELNEVSRRIVRRHWRLIAISVAVAVVVIGSGAALLSGGRTYTGSARLVLDTPDPKSRTESGVIADTAKAIATSPEQVRAALRAAGVKDRSAVAIAKHHVAVTSLGTSAVLQLSVSDRDRHVAEALTNALAQRVIDTRLAVSTGTLDKTLAGLQTKIDDLNTKIAALDVQADSLAERVAGASSAAQSASLRAQRDNVLQSRDLLLQQRSVAESTRITLLSQTAQHQEPSIISASTLPTAADSSHLKSYIVLGLLLGLIVGVALAGILELIRPTLVGGDAVARELGIPFLGSLPNAPLGKSSHVLAAIRARLRVAAEGANVATVGVVPVADGAELGSVAAALGRDPSARLAVRQVALGSAPPQPGGMGLVVVGPSEADKEKTVVFAELLSLSTEPVLGFISYDLNSVNDPQGNVEAGRRAGERGALRLVRRLSWR